MSSLPVETTEPDPAATSLANDQTLAKEGSDPSAPTVKDAVSAEVTEQATEKTEENGAVAKPEAAKVDEKNGDSTEPKPRTYEDGMLKTSATVNHGKSNSKYDPSVLPVTDDPKVIRAQVEFYFSDANLPTDQHLWGLTDGATNLPVSISKICEFGRMKRFRPASAVVAALRDSPFLVVSGAEGQEQVRRRVPYDPTTPRSRAESRSIYVKGFGDEDPSSQFDIEAFFAPYGPTNSVRLRRTPEKLFKGSVFVEFQDEETAQKFLALDPKPLWKGKHVLKIQSKKEYTDIKEQEIKDGKIEPAEVRSFRGRGRGRGGGGGGRGRGFRGDRERGDRDPDDWKKRREEDRASGFKDNRRNDRRGKDRDHRGRGRRDDRGPRSNDRNQEREEKDRNAKAESPENDKKRPRDENGGEEHPEKKTKSEVKAEEVSSNGNEPNEKKRSREDDGADENPSKKADTKTEVASEA